LKLPNKFCSSIIFTYLCESNTLIMKDKILELRLEGKSYSEIQNLLGCSKSTISFHCGEGQKEKNKLRRRKFLQSNENLIIHKLKSRYYGLFILYKGKNNKKVQRLPITFSFDEFLTLLSNNPICYISGEGINFNDSSSWEIDHVIPIQKGGQTIISNLKPVKKWANKIKDILTEDELLENCKKILEFRKFKVVG
jgi:5-methylcytosine-specific restriction endonuclease McrA